MEVFIVLFLFPTVTPDIRAAHVVMFLSLCSHLMISLLYRYGEAADASHGNNNHYYVMGGSDPAKNPSIRLHHSESNEKKKIEWK